MNLENWNAREHRAGNHNGASREIREALKREGKPLSIYKLHLATGFEQDQVKRAVNQMVNISGGLVLVETPHGFEYDLFDRAHAKPKATPARSDSEFAVAGRITIGRGSNWKARG